MPVSGTGEDACSTDTHCNSRLVLLVSVLERMMQKTLGFLLPYIAVWTGIFIFHSAWAAILSYHAGMLAIILLSKHRIPFAKPVTSRNIKIPVIMGLIGAGGGILLYVLWPFLAGPGQISRYVQSIGLNERSWPFFITYFVLVNALLEEYFWRGLLENGSRRITLNDLFFSGYHGLVVYGATGIVWVFVIFLIMCLVAWTWRQLNRLNEGLLPSLACHVVADISVILTIYMRTR